MSQRTISVEHPEIAYAGRRAPASGGLVRLFNLLVAWQQRSTMRRDLAAMPDHLLKDMGITRSDAAREAAKPFWRA